MGAMLEAPEHNNELQDPLPDLLPHPSDARPAGGRWWQSLAATSTRRALLLTALGGLLIAGLITALPRGQGSNSMLSAGAIALGPRGNDTFDHVKTGDCLTWPGRNPDSARIVGCADDHRFEVTESIDMRTFPGSEYGPGAPPPSVDRIRQISQEQCTPSVRSYLGPKYDPNGKFTIGLLWSGEKAWKQSGERRMLCGLQLLGPGDSQMEFAGKVAEIDQSKVWAPGTCLGIDAATNQPTDVPVDCAAPHAMEVTGAVNLADKFRGGLPPESDQDSFIKDACTDMTDSYLAPVQLRSTTLALSYSTISLPSWSAGSHQVSCSIGATLGNGGWSTLVNGAKGELMINGQPPVAPPDIPEERLNLPPIPMPDTSSSSGSGSGSSSSSGSGSSSSSSSSSGSGSSSSSQQTQSQHMPQQQQTATTTAAPTPPQTNTFNPPPPEQAPAPEPVPGPAPAPGPPPGEPAPVPPGPVPPAP
ncbi:putative membrane protein YgcG [Mycobacterium frederiksbergense]|uniref:Membrane protein YgcG n=1 Tax=Mycolicibacterium frederiksbergense TaxID=117567 RepID=A0ABT6KXA3_9MYCO|nr:septum formation family protein [Mycolicibacterium frederiksbergense]MDH6195329.1 putative membrane protein YgcG [Mycolicibacterium frederiksbergense]